jgi:arylsulfatase A-like enzyme
VALFASAEEFLRVSPERGPNVLWINLEDVSAHRLGCYGDDVAETPRIDEFAADARVYRNAFTTSPVCSPSRSAVITGTYQTSIGCHHHRASLDRDYADGQPTPYDAVPPHYVRAFTEYLRRDGYYCVKNGKDDFNFGEPFSVWNEHVAHDADVDWRDRPDADQPFFASFQIPVTHESGMWEPGQKRYGGVPGELETDPAAVAVPPYLPDCTATRRAIARHYDNLVAADRRVGELLDRLEEDGLVDETLVVLWSDHGEGLPRNKSWLYDGGLNVPLVVRWPGEVDPGETDELVSNVDLAPTVLAAAGIDRPPWMEGRTVLGADRADPREYVFAARDRQDCGYAFQRAVRDERFKYIRNYAPEEPTPWFPYRNRHPVMEELKRRQASGDLDGAERWFETPLPAEELYDTETDPHETENLVGDATAEDDLDRLRGALDDWQERTGDLGLVDESQLVDRWWPEGDRPTTATPTFVPNARGNRGTDRTPDGGTFDAPAQVQLFCSTQGASIAYTTESGSDPDWRLYTGPIDLPTGETTLRTKAVRYGYAESDERDATFTCSPRGSDR